MMGQTGLPDRHLSLEVDIWCVTSLPQFSGYSINHLNPYENTVAMLERDSRLGSVLDEGVLPSF